ncbi:MAG: metallophosphoesterase N-terminal domain-containing protein, partial [Candidatus Zixiibacteriota bacterium]
MNREKLPICLVLMIWMTLLLSVGLSFPLTISGVVFNDRNQNLERDGGEKGLAGVVVSDGVEVVATDRDGRYSITTESSRVLFVSLPGDHFANGDFYRRLSGRTSGEMINFPLIKHKTKKTVKFVFFTDPHVTPEPKYNAIAGMQAAIKHMNAQKPVFFISGGDLIEDAERACEPEARKRFDLYRRLSGGFNAPLFNSIGNNDNYGIYLEGVGGDTCIVGEEDPNYGPGMYREYFGPDYYSFNHGEYHFIIFNTIELTWIVSS